MTREEKAWIEQDWNTISPVEFDPPADGETFTDAVGRNFRLMELTLANLNICVGRAPIESV